MINNSNYESYKPKTFRLIHESKLNVSIGLSFIVKTNNELENLISFFKELEKEDKDNFYFYIVNSNENDEYFDSN